ncbi:AAA family ATPase [Roseovarius autotrophicus]|uniref:AAA family ATPase n=1 Tax=Roseovarius autotrophicus TaxID=2824121 RepID=UPI001FFCBD49|nr:ATP-binding protein [Roseovarius autotrophicus]
MSCTKKCTIVHLGTRLPLDRTILGAGRNQQFGGWCEFPKLPKSVGLIYCYLKTKTGRGRAVSNAKQILAMLRSQAEGDQEQFYSIALQVAAGEARQGHRATAEEIRAAVDAARFQLGAKSSVPISFSRPRGDLDSLLDLREPGIRLADVVLNTSIKGHLDAVVLQQQRRDWLREHGKTPSRRLLFAGPPGSGKTMTAEALAGELRLPLFVIRLETLITRFMGETAAKLRLVFDEAQKRRGVYLFDEFDAVGSNRLATNDVAEMRRVLNSFLQFMEEPSATDSLLVAATNHPSLLDRALLRRFDEVLRFEMPRPEEVRAIIKTHLSPMKYPKLIWKAIELSADGLSQAEIAHAAGEAVKEAILSERNQISTADLTRQLQKRQGMRTVFTEEKGHLG